MSNKHETETIEAKNYWQTIMETSEAAPSILDPSTRAIIAYAMPLLETATIRSVSGETYAALKYAMYLYVEADRLTNDHADAKLSNYLASCAMMVALEECCYAGSTWNYGSRLLFDMKRAGLQLKRSLVAAFLAQEGSWSNRSKGDLLDGNVAAVGIYCARLKVLCHILDGRTTSCGGSEEMLEKIEVSQELKTLPETLCYYLDEFAVPYLTAVGTKDAQKAIDGFKDYLSAKSDFYTAPCSTKYHLCRDGGLAEHTLHVLMQLLWMTLPATKRQLGACVLAAIGHDLCKVGVYKKQYKSKKVYLTEGVEVPECAYIKHDQGGSFYWADDFYYEFKDDMPFGHGRKSAYILLGFFPKLEEEVFSAVDGHMADPETNPDFMKLYAENPMALNLHIADALATYLDEHEA